MPYTPPAGDAVELIFAGVYVTPSGDAVELDFNTPPPNTATAEIDGTLGSVTGSAYVTVHAPVLVDGVLDDVTGVIAGVALAAATLEGQLDDAGGDVAAYPIGPASLDGLLDDTTGLIVSVGGVNATLSATLDDVSAAIEINWSAGVFRGLTASRSAVFETTQTRAERQITGIIGQAAERRPLVRSAWQPADAQTAERCAGWIDPAHRHRANAASWDFVPARQAETGGRYSASPRRALAAGGYWRIAGLLERALGDAYRSPPRRDLSPVFGYTDGGSVVGDWWSGFGLATVTDRRWSVLPWEIADPHSWIWGGWHYPPPDPAPPFAGSPELVFYQPREDYTGGAILEFNRPCYAWPLVRRQTTINRGVIIVLHTVNVIRLPDGVNVPALSASLQFDIDSWAWGVSLNLKGPQAMALLEPVGGEPRQVRVEIDGFYFTAMIESWGERRQFGETVYTATGRSPLALLAQPFAPIRSYLETSQKTAAQLIDRELLNTGWSASYHADLLQLFTTDWLVPAGAWSYQNKAPIDAIVQIARAAGARAFADRNAGIVHIAPRYPVSPWNWSTATPDKTIPLGLIRSINTQLSPQPDYNQVYVSGINQGVLVAVKRQGTAGDQPAPMITDSLITYVNAGRERGRNILGNTGRQSRVTLDLPINEITGLLEPGQLVEVSDDIPWRGLVTGISVTGEHGAAGQQVEIERHYS
jgi:hypothetical protein